MTAVSAHGSNDSEDGRGREVETDTSSFIHVEPEPMSNNDDLYCMTPPAYAMSAADNEVSIDQEPIEQEKASIPSIPGSSYSPPQTPRALHVQSQPSSSTSSELPSDLPPVYIQQQTEDTLLASIRRCGILPTRPAVWLVKRNDIALSPLAATVLLEEGILCTKDLDLISQSAGAKRDPSDPLSGFAFATYDTISDIIGGLVAGPVEAAIQAAPKLLKQRQLDMERQAGLDGLVVVERNPSANTTANTTANAAKEIAISTGKGLGKMVGAGFKAPMTYTHAITRGFHNIPKLYNGGAREYENVVDLRSGITVSGKSFAFGFTDGLKDFFVQPMVGAQKEGAKGFAKGVGKGIGNVICKPAAGSCGLLSYSFVGVYKELQGLKLSTKKNEELFRARGQAEYSQAAVQTRQEVVRRWCQINMRQNGRGLLSVGT